MCGIAGILNLDGAPLAPEMDLILRRMGDRIAHRGPDDDALHRQGPIGLVFRRLSIVDIEGGRQPMFNEDRTLTLVANGEIFNHEELRSSLREQHQHTSRSDCEVLLHLYEELRLSFLERLNGMYGLALWDGGEQRLILARDRLGIKPLYYARVGNALIFASEIKALFAYPGCPTRADWATALRARARTSRGAPSSFFHGIEHLEAGCALVADVRSRKTETRRYWSPRPLSAAETRDDERSEEALIEEYRALLDDAVKMSLMSDVEIGMFLSGGIDSVSIARIASRAQRFHTFTVLSQSTLTNGDARAADVAARAFGLENHQVVFSWHDLRFSPDQWKELLWICETPLCEAGQLYKFELHRYAKSVRPGLKVMLNGQGSDEFNGGYATSWHAPGRESASSWETFAETLRELERATLVDADFAIFERSPDDSLLTREFLAAQRKNVSLEAHPWHFYLARNLHWLQQFNLWHEDRTAAGNHIETRVPFLDHRLVEFVMKVPPRHYPALFFDKRILRRGMSDLPDGLQDREKVPFFHGVDTRYTYRMMFNLLMAEDRRLIREAFGEGLAEHPVISRTALEAEIERIPTDPEYAGVPTLLLITNVALLEKMAAQSASDSVSHAGAWAGEVLHVRRIDDWDAEEDALLSELAHRRQEITLDAVLAFPENTYLVREDTLSHPPRTYLAVNDKNEYELDEAECGPWIALLRRIDGRRTLNELLVDSAVSEGMIRKNLEEALDYGVLIVTERGG